MIKIEKANKTLVKFFSKIERKILSIEDNDFDLFKRLHGKLQKNLQYEDELSDMNFEETLEFIQNKSKNVKILTKINCEWEAHFFSGSPQELKELLKEIERELKMRVFS